MPTTALPDDAALPAAVHLAGDRARPLLEVAVAYGDGQLVRATTRQVQYRPGSDAVVRYDAEVSWSGAPPVRETLLAATRRSGALPGAVPLTADVDGIELQVGVWRWPFDPLLPALADLVTPDRAARRLDGIVVAPVGVEVVAYRPTERAVVRVRDAVGAVVYVKVVPPEQVDPLRHRHDALADSGVPVPPVLGWDATAGWLALGALHGDTVRDRLKGAPGPWPDADEYLRLAAAVRDAALDVRSVRTRAEDARGHAAALALVAPSLADPLARLVDALDPEVERSRTRRATIHGDVHEAQLVLDGRHIVGLLDVDDAGIGDPLDDAATVLAHLHFRRLSAPPGSTAQRLGAYVERLDQAFATGYESLGHPPGDLRRVVAASLVGLATGPYRVQQVGWESTSREVIDLATQLAAST
jgi:aminoglycoside phosphotransferase